MGILGSCTVCAASSCKYKCPQCLSPYCSISCCKQHKLACNPTEPSGDVDSIDSSDSLDVWALELENSGTDYIPLRKLELLKHSTTLKMLLSNPHLRRFSHGESNAGTSVYRVC
ncbi:unnamed protein product [Dicrocoelium dendriticum]|nr:unnamed protein product [Dicrocoelium dendriticum]